MSVPEDKLADIFELEQIMELKKTSLNVYQWRRVEALWLKQGLKLSNQKIAGMLDYKPQTVSFILHKWKNDRTGFFKAGTPGGRQRAYLSFDDETRFIAPFLESAAGQGMLDVKDVKREFQNLIGREVADSTIYRLLARHGWKQKKA